MEFQFDVSIDGRPIKIVSIVDEHTRECLAGMVERSITGEHLIAELDQLAVQHGTYPGCCGATMPPELACSAIAGWASGQIGPGSHQRLETRLQPPPPTLGPGHWCGMARDPIILDQATPPGRQPSCNKRPRSSRMARWWVIWPSVMVKM